MKAVRVPISVKCVVIEGGKVWLRKNEREEWELPGGKLEEGEQPGQTAVREAEEELGIRVKTGELVGATLYNIPVSEDENVGVFVIAYKCEFVGRVGEVESVGEAGAAEFKAFPVGEAETLNMTDFYKEWIRNAK